MIGEDIAKTKKFIKPEACNCGKELQYVLKFYTTKIYCCGDCKAGWINDAQKMVATYLEEVVPIKFQNDWKERTRWNNRGDGMTDEQARDTVSVTIEEILAHVSEEDLWKALFARKGIDIQEVQVPYDKSILYALYGEHPEEAAKLLALLFPDKFEVLRNY